MSHSHAVTTISLVAHLASSEPDRSVFADDVGSVTFQQLWAQVRRLARALDTLGARRGDRIAVLAPSSIAWSVWEYAAHALGAIPVGLGTQWTHEHIEHVLDDCTPRILVVANAAALTYISPDRLARCELICVLDGTSAAERCMSQAQILQHASGDDWEPQCRADDPATLIYTSGSTGRPKGIMHTHARVMAAVDAIVGLYPELAGGRLALSWMPMEHLFQRILNLVSHALGMQTQIVMDPRQLVTAVRDFRPTYLAGVPFAYEQLLHAIEQAPAAFEPWHRQVRLMIVGAAPTSSDMLARFDALGYPIRQAYSTSEAIVPIAANTLTDNLLGSVGRPQTAYDCQLSDEGEIRVKGKGLFTGYYGRESTAAALFDSAGYYKTGDFGYLDSDGYLFVTGRREDFFKTSTGHRVSPFEVESAYKRSDLIEHIVVIGAAQKQLMALVQLEPLRAASLRQRLGIVDTATRWADDVRVKTAVLDEMRRHESGLDAYKRVRRIAILSEPLQVATGELTPTLKLRRDVIALRHRAQLEALRAPRRVLLTGATGVLGSELVNVLLADPGTELWVLLRAGSEPELERRSLEVVAYAQRSGVSDAAERIQAIRGDVELPQLGLRDDEYARMASTLTHVVHAAADVRFDRSLDEARRSAVAGAHNIVQLVRDGRTKKLEYVSTVGVAGKQRGLVLEEPQPLEPHGFRNSYEQSKAEAERWLLGEMRGGLDATIHRPTMLVGHSQTGRIRSHQGFYFLVDYFLGFKSERVLPECGDIRMDTVPVDYVARAIDRSTRAPELSGKIVHLCSGSLALGLSDVVSRARTLLEARGVESPEVSYLSLAQYAEHIAANSGSGSRLHQALGQFAPYFADRIDFDNRQSNALLEPAPAVERYLDVVLNAYFTDKGRGGAR